MISTKASQPNPCRCTRGDNSYVTHGICMICRGTGVYNKPRETILLYNASARKPTHEDFAQFDGAHCKRIYSGLPPDWRCPGCRRNKFEILRWTLLYPDKPEKSVHGWAGGYHKHHDHGTEPRGAAEPPRFATSVICEQCNSADGAAKRKLKLPGNFSFSPSEIGLFVKGFPHGKHLTDYEIAKIIFNKLRMNDRFLIATPLVKAL